MISVIDVLKFEGAEKILYTSNGKGVQFYITLTGKYLVCVDGEIHIETHKINKAVDYFNQKCR